MIKKCIKEFQKIFKEVNLTLTLAKTQIKIKQIITIIIN